VPASPPNSDAISVAQLRSQVTGQVIAPGDTGYDEARALFYGGFDRRPAVVVRPADAADVAQVVSLARETGVDLAVRNGGHSAAGFGAADGGITLDMSSLKALEIDAERHTAWAQAGLTAGEYTTMAGAHGLATGFGDTGSVGITGITLGGGIGFMVRKHGLTIDDLLAAEVVTADGQVRHADADTHSDLFWALRGGGGNFGVVTRLQYRLHEIDRIFGGMLILPATPEVITGLVAEADAAPEELSAIANIMVAPPMPFVPAEYHGELIVVVMLVHVGATDGAQRVIDPFRALATPIADMVQPIRYPELYQAEPPHATAMSVRTMFVDDLDRRAAEAIIEHLRASTAPMSAAQVRVLGGAMARVPADATAFAHRDRRLMITVAAGFEDLDETAVHEAWVTGLAKDLRQDDAGAYVNFLSDEGPERVREAYPGATWDRLTAIKARYDPTNLFHLNQNIPPATDDGQA
jgi:FAD/FMN-containing dehydrogenase